MEWVGRRDIDEARWNSLVSAYGDGQPYCLTDYLDVVAEGRWEALIEGDYQRILPLAYNRKLLGLKQYYQPFFCQQGGIFGGQPADLIYFEKVMSLIKHRSVRAIFNLNESTPDTIKAMGQQRTNYILPLNDPYEQLFARFATPNKQRINRLIEEGHQFAVSQDKDVFLEYFIRYTLKKIDPETKLSADVVKSFVDRIGKWSRFYLVRNPQGQILAGAMTLETEKRVILQFQFRNHDINVNGIAALLINGIIQQYAGRDMVFDFEGSDHEGIARFFRSFNPIRRTYAVIRSGRML